MLTIHVHVHTHTDGALSARLDRLDHTLAQILTQGDTLMKANDEVKAFLTQLNTYTNQLAAAEAEQTAKIAEIASDIDALLAGGTLDPEVSAQLAAAAESLRGVAEFETAQTATLTAIAAKNDAPLPPPVVG